MSSEQANRDTIARLTTEVVPTMIERLTRSELGELEVREQGWRIRLRRPTWSNGQAPAVPSATAHRPSPVATHSSPDAHQPRREAERGLITSPAVGYFVPRDGVGVGSSLHSGDLVGHVDVLGVRHEIVTGADGTIGSIEVKAGQAVEYGQPIARLAADV